MGILKRREGEREKRKEIRKEKTKNERSGREGGREEGKKEGRKEGTATQKEAIPQTCSLKLFSLFCGAEHILKFYYTFKLHWVQC
jgi:hypothetical protein